MTRHTLQGRDWSTPTHPQSEARRQHVHGPLLPMERKQLPAPILPRIGLALVLAAIAAAWALETPPAASSGHPEAQHAPADEQRGEDGRAGVALIVAGLG